MPSVSQIDVRREVFSWAYLAKGRATELFTWKRSEQERTYFSLMSSLPGSRACAGTVADAHRTRSGIPREGRLGTRALWYRAELRRFGPEMGPRRAETVFGLPVHFRRCDVSMNCAPHAIDILTFVASVSLPGLRAFRSGLRSRGGVPVSARRCSRGRTSCARRGPAACPLTGSSKTP